jgi:hypothetical protein
MTTGLERRRIAFLAAASLAQGRFAVAQSSMGGGALALDAVFRASRYGFVMRHPASWRASENEGYGIEHVGRTEPDIARAIQVIELVAPSEARLFIRVIDMGRRRNWMSSGFPGSLAPDSREENFDVGGVRYAGRSAQGDSNWQVDVARDPLFVSIVGNKIVTPGDIATMRAVLASLAW